MVTLNIMDKKPATTTVTKNSGDNRNAPGTYPHIVTDDNVAHDITFKTDTSQSIDPKAPRAADPLNSTFPMESAIEADDDDLLELELGGTGTIIIGGIISDADYNEDLRGWSRIKKFDEMRKGDATCRLGLLAVKHPLTSARWFIKPGDGEDDTGPRTMLVKEELFENPNFTWVQMLRQILTFCDYGNSTFEKVFRKRIDGKVGWKKFAMRMQNTIFRWTLDDGVTPGVTQILPTGGKAEIPQWKLLMFVNELEGANYEGISLLRAAYPHYYYKTILYKIDAIATERQGMGVPVIRIPAQATPDDKAIARKIAKQMRVNQHAYLNLPTGFSFEYIDTKAKELKEVKDMVLHHDRQILKAFMAHFLDLGASSSGSFALSDNQQELFLYGEQYLANIVREGLNLAIRELVDLNFGTTKPSQYPTLEVGSIGQTDFEKLSTALLRLSQGGFIVPDDDLERHLRYAMSLPESMQTSDDRNTDPESVRVTPPANLNDPKNIQVKKPIRYTNRELKKQKNEAMQFMEELYELKNDIQTALSQTE